jgi:hypothetical protein
MKRKLATLELWVDDEQPIPTRMMQNKNNETEYRLTINPSDQKLFEHGRVAEEPRKWASIIAHEVGHFVAHVFHSPLQDPDVAKVVGPIYGEREAWDLAYYTNPGINQKIKQFALATYEQAQKEAA